MADRLKDKEDLQLESLFRSESINDGGFSVRVVSRVRRRIWVQRLSLPIAFAIGIAVAAKHLLQLAKIIPGLLDSFPVAAFGLDRIPIGGLPQVSTIIMGAALLATVMMIGRMLEDR
ncbi:MAG: hypothetical protein ACR2Q3_04485 [Woeseiaceae bacterium]